MLVNKDEDFKLGYIKSDKIANQQISHFVMQAPDPE